MQTFGSDGGLFADMLFILLGRVELTRGFVRDRS
jgi:hypothetical protein